VRHQAPAQPGRLTLPLPGLSHSQDFLGRLTNPRALPRHPRPSPVHPGRLGLHVGRVEDRPKIAIAREVMSELIQGLPDTYYVGLMAYGQRFFPPGSGTCSSAVAPARPPTAQAPRFPPPGPTTFACGTRNSPAGPVHGTSN
jgi:hypothetical protein